MKIWEIFHYTYGDVCNDYWYGKEGKCETIGFIIDTEDNIKSLVDKLNANNHSFYAKDAPEDDQDPDENYISYIEIKIETIEEIENRYRQ